PVSAPRMAHKVPGDCDMGCYESVVGRCHPAGRLPLALVDLVAGGYHCSHCLYTPSSDLGGQTTRSLAAQADLRVLARVSDIRVGCHMFRLYERMGTKPHRGGIRAADG